MNTIRKRLSGVKGGRFAQHCVPARVFSMFFVYIRLHLLSAYIFGFGADIADYFAGIGKPLTTKIHVSEDFPEIEKDLEVQVLDITRRPEYGILDKQVAIARQQVKLNRSELLPKVGIKGSYDYVHGLELNNKNFLDDASFSVLLNVSVPLFHFGERSNKVRAAKAKLEQTRLQQQNLNEQMLLELTQAANNLDEAKLESELADRSLQQAEENRRVSKSQYEVGLETLSDHLEAQALWQQAYETKVDARFQLYLNYVAYLKAAGTLHDKL